jgi:hypothetical protein
LREILTPCYLLQAALADYVKDITVPPPAAAKPAAAAKADAAGAKADAAKPADSKPAAAAAAVPAAAAAAAAPAPAKAKEEIPAGVDAKKWKAAVKEGGKKGVELAGCADMGGLEFFTTQVRRSTRQQGTRKSKGSFVCRELGALGWGPSWLGSPRFACCAVLCG